MDVPGRDGDRRPGGRRTSQDLGRAMSPLELAVAAFEKADFANAEKLARQSLATAPDNAVAWHLMGLLAINARLYELASDHVHRALRMAPEYADAHNSLAHVQRELGQWN